MLVFKVPKNHNETNVRIQFELSFRIFASFIGQNVEFPSNFIKLVSRAKGMRLKVVKIHPSECVKN